MKKLITLFSLLTIALVFLAFNTELQTNSGAGNDDNPKYSTIKKNFWEAYQLYNSNMQKGIMTDKPVDPTGTFEIDALGHFNIKHNANTNISPFRNPVSDLVSGYAFSQTTTTYTPINSTGTSVTSNCDDSYYTNYPIGFTFTFNSAPYTAFCVSCNGWASLGSTGTNGYYTPLCSGTPTAISPMGGDLEGLATGNGVFYLTTGSAPNRVLTIEWYHWGFYSNGGQNEFNMQIKLYETTNVVQFVYQPTTPTYSYSTQVGILGATTADFNDRAGTTGWSTTTAGTTACDNVTFSSTYYPSNGLTFSFSPPAPPAVPTLIRPVNHAIGRPLYDTLQWSASSGATNYNLQIAIDSLFATMVFNDTTLTGTAYTIGQFTPLTNWWWRVRAKNANGWSAFTTQWTFRTIGTPNIPTPLIPANNAVNQPISNLVFNWSKAADQTEPTLKIFNKEKEPLIVSNYWFALYTDTTLAPVVVDSTLTDTTKTVSGLINNTNYWWKTRAKNQVGWGTFSAYSKFTTVVAAPAVPTLISPINGALLTNLVPTLDWSNVATATSYRVQVSLDSTFATSQLDSTTTRDSLIVPAGRLSNGATYYWHVRAINAGGNSNYSVIWHFSTPVGIQNIGNEIPSIYKLYNNYPNPFNPVSTIKFDIPKSSDVKLMIFNAIGQEVLTLVNSHFEAGSYSVEWYAANYPSGVYFYKITAGVFSDIHKMVLIK